MNKQEKIKIGDLYRKVEGIGSSSNTYALITGSVGIIVIYEIYNNSGLVTQSYSSQREFLSYYRKVVD